MSKVLSCLLITAFAVSCSGWGLIVRRVLRLEKGAWPSTVALGLAALVALGGLLNLARLVSPASLATLFSIGWIPAAATFFVRCKERRAPARRLRKSAPVWIFAWVTVILLLAYTVITQLPPGAYNLDDDFTAYFAHPVRMVQTGTVFGSLLTSVGVDTLGGQAFIQTFVVAFFPIVYINAADAVFGLILCLLLVCQLAGERLRDLLSATIGIAGVLLIDPQYVNVSALYLGSAFILGLICLGVDTRELDPSGLPNARATGLLYASLASLKATLALFSLLHLVFATIAIVVSTRSPRRGARWAASAAFVGALVLAPWIILHSPNYLAMLSSSGTGVFIPEGPAYHPDLFSSAANMWGISSVRDYTVLMIAVGLSALLALLANRRDSAPGRHVFWLILASAASGIVYYLLTVYSDSQLNVRYFAPVAIAVAPATFVCTLRLVPWNSRLIGIPKRFLLLLCAVSLAVFIPSYLHRCKSAVQSGTILGFPAGSTRLFHEVYENTLAQSTMIKSLQSTIPAGEPILAWLSAPFLLDFSRNPIMDFKHVVLKTYRGRIPKVSYVMLQYRDMLSSFDSASQDPIWQNRLTRFREYAFAYDLHRMMSEGDTLFDNGSIKVVRLRP
jgi:hypothetical protein